MAEFTLNQLRGLQVQDNSYTGTFDFNASMEDDSSDIGDVFSKGLAAAVVSGGVGLVNTGYAVANMFGADIEQVRTENILESWDWDDTRSYYLENKEIIDTTGFVLSSFIPAAAGLKAAKYAQAAAAGTSSQNLGAIALRKALVPRNYSKTMREQIAVDSLTTMSKSQRILAGIHQGAHQAAIESAFAETAILLSTNQHVTVNKDELGYWEAIWDQRGGFTTGMMIGTGLGGALYGAVNYRALTSLVEDKQIAENVMLKSLMGLDASSNRLDFTQGNKVVELASRYKSGVDDFAELTGSDAVAFQRRSAELENELVESIAELTGETVGNADKTTGLKKINGHLTPSIVNLIKKGKVDEVAEMFHSASSVGKYDDIDFIFDPKATPVQIADTGEEYFDAIGRKHYGDKWDNPTPAMIADIESSARSRGINVYDAEDKVRSSIINREIIDSDGVTDVLDPEHLIGVIRHEIGHSNTLTSANMRKIFKSPQFSNILDEMKVLSRKARPSKWRAVDENNKIIAKLEAKGKLTAEDADLIAQLRQGSDYLNMPEELMADAWHMFNARDPKLRDWANSTGLITRKIMAGNQALRTQLGHSERLFSLDTGKIYDSSWWAPTVADRGNVDYRGGVVSFGNEGIKVNKAHFSVTTATPDQASAHYYAAVKDAAAGTNIKQVQETNWDNFYQLTFLHERIKSGRFSGTVSIKMPDDSIKLLDTQGDRAKLLTEFESTFTDIKTIASQKLTATDKNVAGHPEYQIARILDTDENFVLARGADPQSNRFFSNADNIENPTVGKIFYKGEYDESNRFGGQALASSIRQNLDVLQAANQTMDAFIKEIDDVTAVNRQGGATIAGTVVDPSWMYKGFGDTTDITASSDPTSLVAINRPEIGSSQSKMQSIAKFNEIMKARVDEFIQEVMTNPSQKVASNPTALMELNVLDSKLRQNFYYMAPDIRGDMDMAEYLTGLAEPTMFKNFGDKVQQNIQQLISSPEGKKLIANLKKGKDGIWERDLEELLTSVVNQKRFQTSKLRQINELADNVVTIQSPDVTAFWKAKIQVNELIVNGKQAVAGARGLGSNLDPRVLYPNAVNPQKFKHRKYVEFTGEGVYGRNRKGIIGANTPQELAMKEQQVREAFGDGATIRSKEEFEKHFELNGNFDEEFSLSEFQSNADLQRKGVQWDVAPEPDDKLVSHYIRSMSREWGGIADNVTEIKYAEEVASLEINDRVLQTFGTKGVGSQEPINSPFRNTRNILLNRTSKEHSKKWRDAQQYLDKTLTTAFNHVSALASNAQKGTVSYEEVNDMMKHYGMPLVYNDQIGNMLRTSTKQTEQALASLVPQANGIASTLMLRLDYIQPIINALSMPVMSVPEMNALFKSVPALQKQQAMKGLQTAIPDTEFTWASNFKLQMQAVKDFFTADGKEMLKRYQDEGLITNIAREMRQVADDVTIDVSLDATSMKAKLSNAGQRVANFASKPADFAEDFVKFVAARQADLVMDAAGIADKSIRRAALRSYVTNVHGNYVQAQRPTLFQGFAGQAIGLFQTYQFNLIQSLLGKIGNKELGAAGAMMGIQAGMFGTQSVPGFKALNEYVAMNSAEDRDFYSAAGEMLGTEESEWMLFGLASNMTKPLFGEGLELYTRGDLNPRTPFIIPTSLAEVPAYSMATKFFSSMLNGADDLSQGVSAGQVLADTLAHNGVNRPLSGIGQMLAGVRTTSKGTLLTQLEDLSWFAMAARTLGTKTLDESIAVQSYYRTKGFDSKRQDKLQDLGRGVKRQVQSGDHDTAAYDGFFEDYATSGGNPESFNEWIHHQGLAASESSIFKMYKSNDSHSGRYLQNVMGYDIEDYINPSL